MIRNRSYIRQDQKRVVNRQNPDEDSEDNLILDAVSDAFSEAAVETMILMGYNIMAEDGWVIKKFANGTKEKVKKIGRVDINSDTYGK